jgi:hypothetical protein
MPAVCSLQIAIVADSMTFFLRMFVVGGGSSLSITGVTMQNGKAADGGAIMVIGGYAPSTNLELIGCTFKTNTAGTGGAIACNCDYHIMHLRWERCYWVPRGRPRWWRSRGRPRSDDHLILYLQRWYGKPHRQRVQIQQPLPGQQYYLRVPVWHHRCTCGHHEGGAARGRAAATGEGSGPLHTQARCTRVASTTGPPSANVAAAVRSARSFW